MGIHVSIVDKEGNEHPEWDCIRYSGDRSIPKNVQAVGEIKDSDCSMYDEPRVRPSDLKAFRDLMTKEFPDNETRWNTAYRILSQDSELWFSYSF